MEKTLSFTDTSPQKVKIGDTTTSFTLICGNYNEAVDLTHVNSITVKLGNASGYLKSITIDPTSLTDPTAGQVAVAFNSDLIKSLPAGRYSIEVWVVDSTGTSIYPSDGSVSFTITNNIQNTTGETITTITFDDFVAAMNKAASTIAKGDKGDKGDVGATGPQGPEGPQGLVGPVGPQGLNGLTTATLLDGTDINQLTTPGAYNLYIKLAKNTPLDGSDQGSMLLVWGPNKDSDWMAQLLLTFYSGAYYRADSTATIKAGKTAWKKLAQG
ncbi:collagen-like protein [Lactiplantibacillus plantarum]|uniref:collagen-like protein n=1 Tax=Lactiplantibacillus plantarum TaxID=1590 RepID=UPI0021CB0BFF|nr:collagen-like protein [Lactiplantibacillus plantarum]